MRVLCRCYDLDDLGGSGASLRTLARFLRERGDEVWATNHVVDVDAVAAWGPDVIIGQQWATAEATCWATQLHVPFVMLVHGPEQYEQFRPQCDLVVFNAEAQLALAREALGRTPSLVLHPPVFRHDYETGGGGECVTWVGGGTAKGSEIALAMADAFPDERFLFVTRDDLGELPPNVEVRPPLSDLRTIYARTKLLLVPSRYESYGRVAVEAAMSGIPAVVADLPGIREATDGLATCVADGANWTDAVRHALATLDERRAEAVRLATQRDPEPQLIDFRERLLAIAASGRRRPTLTLCMTVANEAATLEQAINSVAGVVDEIVIGVDTKSTDDTLAIARRLATRVFEYDESCPPDFPRMRNRAMALVETDWALVLDGHEWIEHADRIRGALETDAWSIEVQTLFEPDEQRVPGLAFPFPRIHRRHVRFAGAPVHEEVATPIERRVTRTDIHLWHERKPGAAADSRTAEKSGAELVHLRDAWERRHDRRALFYLANGLRESARYQDAIDAYEKYLLAPNFAEEGWQAQLYLARCHAARRDWDAATRAFEAAVLAAPERAEAIVGLGYVRLETGDARRAAAWFRMAAALPEPRDCRLFVEVPVYRWGAWHGLALALHAAGDEVGAADAQARAVERGAGTWARDNLAWWRARAGSTIR